MMALAKIICMLG